MEYFRDKSMHYYFEPANVEDKKGTLVFVHGFAASPHYFFLINKDFREYDCYFVALPGHGQTPTFSKKDLTINGFANALIKWIDEMEINELTLIGHSMGGAIAMIVANTLAFRIKQLILVCPYFYGYNKNVWNTISLFPSLASKHPDRLLKNLYVDYRNNYKTAPEVRREPPIKDNHEIHNNFKTIIKNFIFDFKSNKILKFSQKNLRMPTFLMVSKQDRILHYKSIKKQLIKNKNIEIFEFENSGHIPFIEETKLFSSTLNNYLDKEKINKKNEKEKYE